MNNIMGIDLSLRSTGISFNEQFELIQIEKLNDEELIIEICKRICDLIEKFNPIEINLEGLSFNSISGSKDIIAGLFWNLRCKISQQFSNIKVNIIPVTTWRSPLFNKEDNKALKEGKKEFKLKKKSIKGLKGVDRKEAIEYNQILESKANIKQYTFDKLPSHIKEKIINKTDGKGCYDLSDAYFISQYRKSI